MKLSVRFPLLITVAVATCVLGIASAAKDEAQEHDYTGWAIDPTAPGPDLPPVGRSLFDHLIADRSTSRYHIAFPFWTFVDRIRERLAQQEYAGGTRATLIPMGRSLQRAAATSRAALTLVATTADGSSRGPSESSAAARTGSSVTCRSIRSSSGPESRVR